MIDVILPTGRGMAWLAVTLSTLLTQTSLDRVGSIFVVDDTNSVKEDPLFIVFVEAFKQRDVRLEYMPGLGGKEYEYKPNFYWYLERQLTYHLDYVLFLDDDLALHSNFIDEIVRNAEGRDMVSAFMLVLDEGITEEDVTVDNGQDWLLTGMALYSERLLKQSMDYVSNDEYLEEMGSRFKDWGFLMDSIDNHGFTCKVVPTAKGWHLGVASNFTNWERDMCEWRKTKGR